MEDIFTLALRAFEGGPSDPEAEFTLTLAVTATSPFMRPGAALLPVIAHVGLLTGPVGPRADTKREA
jgi:hypothetical protein